MNTEDESDQKKQAQKHCPKQSELRRNGRSGGETPEVFILGGLHLGRPDRRGRFEGRRHLVVYWKLWPYRHDEAVALFGLRVDVNFFLGRITQGRAELANCLSKRVIESCGSRVRPNCAEEILVFDQVVYRPTGQ